jgi:hypothetical protein
MLTQEMDSEAPPAPKPAVEFLSSREANPVSVFEARSERESRPQPDVESASVLGMSFESSLAPARALSCLSEREMNLVSPPGMA